MIYFYIQAYFENLITLCSSLPFTHPQLVKEEDIFDHRTKCAQPRRAVKDEKEKGVGGEWGEQRHTECEKAGEEGIREREDER